MTLIAKPFITVLGNEYWCDQIVSLCIPNLPMEPTEWYRKKGSSYKIVHVDIDSKEFSVNHLSTYCNDNILSCPLFHIFVILENEDIYYNSAKNAFSTWIGHLRSRSIDNWKIIIVPDNDNKTKHKFAINKFMIFNKLKTDFNLQKIENHSIRLSEIVRDRFIQIQKFLRETVLSTYDDQCFKIEDKIRIQRETRYTHLWNYFDFFCLQEELADIYECLNLYDDSLAQFDESDAVFSNCLESFHQGENAVWIVEFRNVSFEKIDCLILTNYSDPEKRINLSSGRLCLADFRAYLLSRQCALLQLLNRYQEIPKLVYLTLLKFLNECKLLEQVQIDSNLKNCWIFLTALQALQRFSPIDCEEHLVQDYAALFRLALNSINKLALSLNIWNPLSVDWSPIEILREKLSILSNDEFGDTPSSRLASGFKSQKHFQEFHSKLFEEALMIWKHINRIRSANLLGIQLADLYLATHMYDKAEPLYLKAIKCLRNENWAHLAMPLRLKLAVCQKDTFEQEPEKYLKTCIHLAGATFSTNQSSFNSYLSLKNDADHQFYFAEFKRCIKILFDKSEKPQQIKMKPLLSVGPIRLSSSVDNGFQVIDVILISHLPESTDIKIKFYGIPFSELDLTESLVDPNEDLKSCDNDLIEFPAHYSIPLTSSSSPKFYRAEKPVLQTQNIRKKIECQKSIEEFSHNNEGVFVHFIDSLNGNEENSDKMMSLVCLPKTDDGLRARKLSMSPDVGCFTTTENKRNSNDNEHETVFELLDGTQYLTIVPGNNIIKLKSKKYGLYIPNSIEILMFNEQVLMEDLIYSDMLDDTWKDHEAMLNLLPSIVIDDSLDNYGFLNFINTINPKIKMGKLAFPANDIQLKIYVNDVDKFPGQTVVLGKSQDCSNILSSEKLFSFPEPLKYELESESDKVTFCIPNILRKPHIISYFENICLSKNIVQTSGSKCIVSVDLQRPVHTMIQQCNYLIKNPTLKLHHQNEVRELLPLAHRCLATGIFNDQTNFTILWILESLDFMNFEKECLRFTLSIDLNLDVNQIRNLTGVFTQDFELYYN